MLWKVRPYLLKEKVEKGFTAVTLTVHSPSPGCPLLLHGGRMARGDRGVVLRAKPVGFGAVPLGVAPEAPRSRAGSFTGSSSRINLIWARD